MRPQGLHAVMGTRRRKTATIRQIRCYRRLINTDTPDQHSGGESATSCGISPACNSMAARSRVTWARFHFIIVRRGISTRRHVAISGFKRRKLSHRSRLARFRSTARRLYFFPHMTPHRRKSSGAGATTTSIPRPTYLVPSRRTWSNSVLQRSLSLLQRDFTSAGSQPGTALLTATLQNQTAARGGHTGAETQSAFTTDVGRLKRSFHDFSSFLCLIFS